MAWACAGSGRIVPAALRARYSAVGPAAASPAWLSFGIDPALPEHHCDIALGDRLALGDEDFLDHSGARREQRDFHLHRFEDDQRVFFADAVADRNLDLPHRAGDLALYPQIGHVPSRPRALTLDGGSDTAVA